MLTKIKVSALKEILGRSLFRGWALCECSREKCPKDLLHIYEEADYFENERDF